MEDQREEENTKVASKSLIRGAGIIGKAFTKKSEIPAMFEDKKIVEVVSFR